MVWSLMSELLSLRRSKWLDIGFNLCVVPFPNIYVPNFKLEDLCQRFSENLEVRGSEGQRFGGLEVLGSKWFNIQTSKCYRELELFNSRLVLMYDGGVEARMREQKYWNSLIYWKQKDENWDRDLKMRLEFKRTKMEWWRQMKIEMWLGFSEVVWGSWRAMVMHRRSWGLVEVCGLG